MEAGSGDFDAAVKGCTKAPRTKVFHPDEVTA